MGSINGKGSQELGFSISRNVKNTDVPPIPQAAAWARNYQPTSSRPLLDMSQGVPGTPPPPQFLEALALASSSPASAKYGTIAGEPELRSALQAEMQYVYGKDADITPDDICLTTGCNMAFMATIMTLAGPGDEVILPIPWYFNNQMTLTMLGIKPVPLHTSAEGGFVPSIELCAKLITGRTKAIALVTPNNPTGAIYSPDTIKAFAQLARDHNIALVLDETYRDFILPGPPHSLFNPSALLGDWNWRRNLVHLFSFSKSYCVPGHRLGAIVASPALQRHIHTVLDCMQICPPRPVQLALAPLMPSFRPFIHASAEALKARHDLFRACLPPPWRIGAQGGFFAFVRHPFKGMGATEVCRRLAEEWGIVLLPAEFFGYSANGVAGAASEPDDERWIRFAVANVDDDKIRMVCERLKSHLGEAAWEVD
ncbi:PLP-dependent transferase [Dentipellis sp. KUC8613]|nr:PLP-dependent transferase [Dentipellis sp. KUC8613]